MDMEINRENQKTQTHNAILEAARESMRESGFRKTTIRQIANHAKVATGTVMAHFGSKEDLLYELFYDDIELIAEQAFSSLPPQLPLNEQLMHIGSTFLNQYSVEKLVYTDFLENSLFAKGKWGERFTKQAEQVGTRLFPLFANAVQQGEIKPDTDLRPAIAMFFSNYYFVLINQIKTNFEQIDAGISLLRTLINHHYDGIKQ